MEFEFTACKDGTGYELKRLCTGKNVVIPSEYKGKPVVSLGSYFAAYVRAGTIVIPESVKELKHEAFLHVTADEIIIPATISKIPKKCFGYSTIKKITFAAPENVKKVSEYAFYKSNIDELVWPSGCDIIPKACFKCSKSKHISGISHVTEIMEGAFEYSCITHFVVPKKVNCIPEMCFNESALYSVEFENPQNLQEIKKGAFRSTLNLTRMVWPSGCEEIPAGCFENSNICEISGIENVKKINPGAFTHTKKLKTMEWPKKCNLVPERCFEYSGITQLGRTSEITYVEAKAFMGSNISSISLPSVIMIAESSFELSDIASIDLSKSESLFSVNKRAFAKTSNLKKVKWSPFCTTIPEKCFFQSSIKEISGIENVEVISDWAFAHSGIESITWPPSCCIIPEGCFTDTPISCLGDISNVVVICQFAFSITSKLKEIYWPKHCSKIPAAAFHGSEIERVYVQSDNINIMKDCFLHSKIKEIHTEDCEAVMIYESNQQELQEKLKVGFSTLVHIFKG